MSEDSKSWQGLILLIIAILCLVAQAKSQTATFTEMDGIKGNYEIEFVGSYLKVCHNDKTHYESIISRDTFFSSVAVYTVTPDPLPVKLRWVFYWELGESGRPVSERITHAYCSGYGSEVIHFR